jgi:hypothetical protein
MYRITYILDRSFYVLKFISNSKISMSLYFFIAVLDLGLVHTREKKPCILIKLYVFSLVWTRPYSHETQYCDKKIILIHRFLFTNQGKLLKTYLDLFCLFIYFDLFICQELTLAIRYPWLKNIFLSQYCASKCLV